MSIKERLARGAGWLAASRIIINLIGFASTILLARLLVPADFGLVAIAGALTAIAGSITELSLSSALVQHKNPQQDDFDSAWTLNVIRAFLLAGVIAASAKPVGVFYEDPRLTNILLASAATTLLTGLSNPKLVVFSRNLVFWQNFVLSVSNKLTGFIVSISIAIVYQSYWALVIGSAAAQIIGTILSYVLLPYRPRPCLSQARGLLVFSVWLTLGRVVNIVTWRTDHLFIGYFLGAGKAGIYSFADNLAGLPMRESTAPITETLFPGFVKMVDERNRLRSAYMQAQTLICSVALPIGFGFALLAEPLIMVLVGPRWEPAVIFIQWLAVIFAIQHVSCICSPPLWIGRAI